MSLVLHGIAGGWDELLIAVFALGILWLAVKLAGRGRPDEEEPAPGVERLEAPAEEVDIQQGPVEPPPAAKRG